MKHCENSGREIRLLLHRVALKEFLNKSKVNKASDKNKIL